MTFLSVCVIFLVLYVVYFKAGFFLAEVKSHLAYQSINKHRCSLQLTESSTGLEFSIQPASVRSWPSALPQFLVGRPSSFPSHSINAVAFHRMLKFYAF